MSWLKDFKLLRLVPLAAFFLALPALAQFDASGETEATHKQAPKNKAALARPTSPADSRTTAGAVAKGDAKGNRASSAHHSGGPSNVKTNGCAGPGLIKAAAYAASKGRGATLPQRRLDAATGMIHETVTASMALPVKS